LLQTGARHRLVIAPAVDQESAREPCGGGENTLTDRIGNLLRAEPRLQAQIARDSRNPSLTARNSA
jgi:hypothetical protein